MTENEQIARWLGWHKGTVGYWEHTPVPVFKTKSLPNFRTSNKWAGAVLEKLGKDGVQLYSTFDVGKNAMVWVCIFGYDDMDRVLLDDWRSAVIDAALEVIRRADSATAGQS